jgi:serine/threonine protein phosphatase PrpC
MSSVDVRADGMSAAAAAASQLANSELWGRPASNASNDVHTFDSNKHSSEKLSSEKLSSEKNNGAANGHGHGGGGGGGGGSANGFLGSELNHSNGGGDSGSPPGGVDLGPVISESREEASHANATKSHQHHGNNNPSSSHGGQPQHLVLPKFKKNQRKIDHSSHVHCCDPPPPGRSFAPSAAALTSDGGAGILCRNDVGYHGIAAHNVGTRDHMEDRHRVMYGRPDGLFRAFFGVFGQHHTRSKQALPQGLSPVSCPSISRCLFFIFFCPSSVSLSDGHGGEEASHYAHQHLGRIVAEQLYLQYRQKSGAGVPALLQPARAGANGHSHASASALPLLADGGGNGGGNGGVSVASMAAVSVQPAALAALGLDYKVALERAFDILEEDVLKQSRTLGCKDGTTVTCVLAAHDALYCANTGDSRTVLCRDGHAVALSHDHKPGSADERARIEAAGGEVRAVMLDRAAFCCWQAKKVPHGAERLWPGGFSVSRAVGDIDYKDVRRKKANVVNVLIHRPDVTVTSLNPRDQFVICGSDGLWDVLTNQQAVEFVLREMRKRKKEESMSDIAQKLADHAYSLGSEDNITAVVTFLVNNELPHKAA